MKKKDFNRGWLFGAVGKEQSMQPVTLPHDAMLYEKRSKDAATAGACGYFPGGAYVYVKRILVENILVRLLFPLELIPVKVVRGFC